MWECAYQLCGMRHEMSLMSRFCLRYTVGETADLLRDIGFRDYEVMRTHGVTGGDLLELTDQELREELGLPHLQVSHSEPFRILLIPALSFQQAMALLVATSSSKCLGVLLPSHLPVRFLHSVQCCLLIFSVGVA